MKKALSVVLAAAMCLSLAGCGGGNKSEAPARQQMQRDLVTRRLRRMIIIWC